MEFNSKDSQMYNCPQTQADSVAIPSHLESLQEFKIIPDYFRHPSCVQPLWYSVFLHLNGFDINNDSLVICLSHLTKYHGWLEKHKFIFSQLQRLEV